ncbi:MAG: argininosuccinate lyase [Syntrophaceae bacterium]|nr:argininosuccinate lyase [Syntrophaceae bacterium]
MSTRQKKLWGGRFREPTDKMVEAFTASIGFDRRLYRYDIEGSIAHAKMLAKQGIITKKDEKAIIRTLRDILHDIEKGRFVFRNEDEDIHMAIEKALIARAPEAGGKLHAGRSRNDQVSLDLRMYLREVIVETLNLVAALKLQFIAMAKTEMGTIMPGYTHLQKAQPVLLSHYLLAYWEMLDRDEERLRECSKRVNVMPLGSAALAGTGLPIDRAYTARVLKFPEVSRNSMDAVSDRDYVAEFIFVASLIMMHLSRFCEDIILWSTDEFNFLEMSDAFTTGSSIMPQKKNPDAAELIRGKTGRVYGNLVALLTLMKGLPMTYNRDLQEDKEPLFDTVDSLKGCLAIITEMMKHITFKRERMHKEASGGFSAATDVAEYLVMKGIPFRESHGIAGRLVAYCLEKNKEISDLTIKEFQKFHEAFEKDIVDRISVKNVVDARKSIGGTSEKMVLARIREIEGRTK